MHVQNQFAAWRKSAQIRLKPIQSTIPVLKVRLCQVHKHGNNQQHKMYSEFLCSLQQMKAASSMASLDQACSLVALMRMFAFCALAESMMNQDCLAFSLGG
jgi:hypothetical protein